MKSLMELLHFFLVMAVSVALALIIRRFLFDALPIVPENRLTTTILTVLVWAAFFKLLGKLTKL